MVFSASRVIFCAAEARLLPGSKWIAVINKKFNTPARALMVNYVITIVLIVVPPPGAAFGKYPSISFIERLPCRTCWLSNMDFLWDICCWTYNHAKNSCSSRTTF